MIISLVFLPFLFSEHLDPINVKIAELREALESVTAEQKYLKARDARHRHSKSFFFLKRSWQSEFHIFWGSPSLQHGYQV